MIPLTDHGDNEEFALEGISGLNAREKWGWVQEKSRAGGWIYGEAGGLGVKPLLVLGTAHPSLRDVLV